MEAEMKLFKSAAKSLHSPRPSQCSWAGRWTNDGDCAAGQIVRDMVRDAAAAMAENAALVSKL